jgi:pyridoxamine 5'-phosphate oxidase
MKSREALAAAAAAVRVASTKTKDALAFAARAMKSKDAVAVVAAASAATAAFLLYRRRRSRRPPFVPLRRSELPTHPYDLAQRWIDEHQRATNFLEAHCVCLATSSPSGGATARTVLLQKLDQNVGLIFGSQASSLKGSDAAADVRAEAVLRLGERQVRFRGTLRLGDAGQSDDAFHRVPRGAQLGLTLLRQGTPCNDDEYAAIEQRWLALAAADDGEAPVARPADFSAFILEPATVEFYQGGHPGFCNDRFLYKQIGLAGFVLEGRLMA